MGPTKFIDHLQEEFGFHSSSQVRPTQWMNGANLGPITSEFGLSGFPYGPQNMFFGPIIIFNRSARFLVPPLMAQKRFDPFRLICVVFPEVKKIRLATALVLDLYCIAQAIEVASFLDNSPAHIFSGLNNNTARRKQNNAYTAMALLKIPHEKSHQLCFGFL